MHRFHLKYTGELKSGKQHRTNHFSVLSLPVVEIVPAPRGSILHVSRPSQLPYNEKSENCSENIYFYINF